MVRRHHGHRGIRIVAANQKCGQADAGRRVALARLADDRSFRQLGQLLAHRCCKPLVGDDQPPLVRRQVAKPVDRLTEHGRVTDKLQQLLRRFVGAGRPKTGARAAGHDDRVKHGRVESRESRVKSR
jgi:hypothetical protein